MVSFYQKEKRPSLLAFVPSRAQVEMKSASVSVQVRKERRLGLSVLTRKSFDWWSDQKQSMGFAHRTRENDFEHSLFEKERAPSSERENAFDF